jgi:replicative DNA helicase
VAQRHEIPFDADMEANVLGAAITDPTVRQRLLADLTSEHFHIPNHREVFAAIRDIEQRGGQVDEITIRDELEGWHKCDRPAAHIVSNLLGQVGVPRDAIAYIPFLIDKHARRRFLSLVTEQQKIATNGASLERLPEIADVIRSLGTSSTIASAPTRLVNGGTFILDVPASTPALWGKDDDVLLARGESSIVYGPSGIGKTTLVQQLVLRLIGARDDDLLGFPVTPIEGRVFYIAADRPSQAARSFARMVDESDREVLNERLAIWKGPPDRDITEHPGLLLDMARERGAGLVVIDSLKDVAMDLEKGEIGSRLNRAIQTTLAAGVEVIVLHHPRKQTVGGGPPRHIDDVYGSTWITAGTGSVILLWGKPGDLVVELSHLKQPAGQVGPLKLLHDHGTGMTTIYEQNDVLTLLNHAHNGLSAPEAARALFETTDPKPNDVEKARRRLGALVRSGQAVFREGTRGGEGGSTPGRWYRTSRFEEVS